MSSSPPAEAPRPISDRAREWCFCLYCAHLVNGKPAEALLNDARAVFVISDEAWNDPTNRSLYVPDPRLGRIAYTVWARIEASVIATLSAMIESRDRLEGAIRQASTRWRVERIVIVDRALLTLGAFELIERQARPAKRVINRTVELAKRFGSVDSRRFVNGILDQIRKDHSIEGD